MAPRALLELVVPVRVMAPTSRSSSAKPSEPSTLKSSRRLSFGSWLPSAKSVENIMNHYEKCTCKYSLV